MNYIRFGRGLAVALLLGLFSRVYGQEDQKLTIFVDNSYPPYMYEMEGTDADGLYPRLLKEAVKQAGLNAQIKAFPWKRALLHSAAGKGAVGGAYKNDERVKMYDFSLPLYQEKLVLFVNKNNSFEFSTIEDLDGKVVGVNRGWSYGQEFDAARELGLFEVHISNESSDNFKMLALGRIDCVILEQRSGDLYTQLLGVSDQVVSLPRAFSINSGYLIVPKKLAMKPFLAEFNAALVKMREDGVHQSIVEDFIQGAIVH